MTGSVDEHAAQRERAFPRRGRRTMRDRVKPTQRWLRRGDDQVFTVVQVHHKDRLAQLRGPDGGRLFVTYDELRRKWGQVA
jgi:hypothetical protein